jgi:predicted deacylase
MTFSPIWSDIDWEAEGRQLSYLNLEHSVHRAPYSIIQIPVAVFRNGVGPTILLMAGIHGDEYEGQVALQRLIQSLDIAQVRGRIIVLPAVNLPAVQSATRTSPLDGVNLNRAFTPKAADGPTRRIAEYLTDVIFPMTDYCFDLHTAGEGAEHFPATYATLVGEPDADARSIDALEFMGAPLSWAQFKMDGPFSEWAAVEKGVKYFGSEFGGGGILNPEMLQHAERSIYRLLAFTGVYPLSEAWSGKSETRLVSGSSRGMLFAPCDGVFLAEGTLGADVHAGSAAGWIYTPETPGAPPVRIDYPIDGVLCHLASTGRVRRGDCVVLLMVEGKRNALIQSAQAAALANFT